VVTPNIFWFRAARQNLAVMWIAAGLINVGMWCERFVIIVTSLHRDFLTSSWKMFHPTWVDISLYVGTLCLFGTLILLFVRFLPSVAVSEVKELRVELAHGGHGASHGTPAQGPLGVPAAAPAAPLSGKEA
jgi:hypothetical protein